MRGDAASDFANPEIAKAILALYGEDRGDGLRRLYRFPVVFPADNWQAVMPRPYPPLRARAQVHAAMLAAGSIGEGYGRQHVVMYSVASRSAARRS